MLNFTNIFTLSFCARRFQKRKKTVDLTVFFTLLSSVSVKAVSRTLMKLNLGVNFINVLHSAFALYVNMLMKLTTDLNKGTGFSDF